MNTRGTLAARIAGRLYALLVGFFGVFLLFLAWVMAGAMHVSETAWIPAVPAVIFLVLSVFIWRGAGWAMIVATMLWLALAVMLASDESAALWIALCAAAICGILTTIALLARRSRAEPMQG
jgi:hypothetical protein